MYAIINIYSFGAGIDFTRQKMTTSEVDAEMFLRGLLELVFCEGQVGRTCR